MYAMPPRVTAAEFVRHFGEWQDRAAVGPIAITHHGRERLVAMSATSYHALSQQAEAVATSPIAIDDSLITHISEGFALFDRDLHLIVLSHVAATCLGLTGPGDAQAGDMIDPLLRDQLARTLRTGEEGLIELCSPVRSDRWLRLRCFAYMGGIACLIRDVTDELGERRRILDEAAMTAALMAHGRIGKARLSPRGTFAEIEAAFAALAGFDVEALIRTRFVDLLALDRRILASSHLEDVLTGGSARAFESSLLMRGGDQRPVRIALAAHPGNQGAVAIVTAGE